MKPEILQAKVTVFIKNWDRFCVELMIKSKMAKDNKMNNFANQVLKIPLHIKEIVAENFIRASKALHAHVFAIFRCSSRKPNCYSLESELEDHASKVLDYLYRMREEAEKRRLKYKESEFFKQHSKLLTITQKTLDKYC